MVHADLAAQLESELACGLERIGAIGLLVGFGEDGDDLWLVATTEDMDREFVGTFMVHGVDGGFHFSTI
jgi:hypothetical protein